MITRLSQIVEEACGKGRKRLAVACGNDEHTLQAVFKAYDEGLVEPIIFGDREEIERVCKEQGFDAGVLRIVNVKVDTEAVAESVKCVATGQADVLMKGLVSTDKYMRGILDKDAGLFPPGGLLSHVAVVELPGRDRLLTIADVAVIPLPDFKQKVQIIKYLTHTANTLGVEVPKIACIAPSEQVLPKVVSSTDGAILAKMADRGQLGRIKVDGPLSLDVSLNHEVALEKKVKGSDVAGYADCLLFPNIESGNVFFKAATHLAGAEIAAMVVGTRVPCVLTSRGDTPLAKFYSIALACLHAHNQ